jgi:hypothetical protein
VRDPRDRRTSASITAACCLGVGCCNEYRPDPGHDIANGVPLVSLVAVLALDPGRRCARAPVRLLEFASQCATRAAPSVGSATSPQQLQQHGLAGAVRPFSSQRSPARRSNVTLPDPMTAVTHADTFEADG